MKPRTTYNRAKWLLIPLQLLWWLCVLFCFASCQTLFPKRSSIPQNLSLYKKGAFSGPITFYQKGKKHYFHGDIFISQKNKIRIDFNVGPGVPILTLILNQKHITLLLLKKKEFYKGPLSSLRIKKVFFLTEGILPLLGDLFFDRSPTHLTYVCKKTLEGLPSQCQSKKWQIQWQRKGKRLLSLKQANLEWHFQYDFFSVEVDDTLFDITIPPHFKPLTLLK